MNIFAHGDLDKRILAASKEIKSSPDSAYLYFKRGKLYFQHEEYNKSIKDLEDAEKLNYHSEEQNLLFARNYFALKNYKKAVLIADVILSEDSNLVLAIRLKAQAYFELKQYQDAALLFESVIDKTNQTFPENYVEASFAWELQNTDEAYQRGVSIINKGIETLGEISSLQDRLIEMALNKKDYELALSTQKRIVQSVKRKESALYRLSEIYELSGNNNLALENLKLAKVHFYELPLRIQNTSFMKHLLENINKKEILLQTK
jgi:tetratricopeptide (TPR) repeat protein